MVGLGLGLGLELVVRRGTFHAVAPYRENQCRANFSAPQPIHVHESRTGHTTVTRTGYTRLAVLNEVNYEHHMTPAFYTSLYDAIVAGIRKWAPRGTANMKFMGLGGAGASYVSYFLNSSNHVAGTPVDMISIHHYAEPSVRNGSTNASGYHEFFTSGDGFISTLSSVYREIAAGDYPDCLLDADEVGVILPDDNDPKYTADAPGFPAIFWNAAASM